MEYLKNFWNELKNPRWLWIALLLGIIVFVLLYISEGQFPNLPLSSGIVAFISAVIGVLLTAFAISAQLKLQSEAETQKDKGVEIFKQKIPVYKEFTSKLWELVYAFDDSNPDQLAKKFDVLKSLCFDKLVFFLKQNETKQLTGIIEKFDMKKSFDYHLPLICKITNLLQNSLDNNHENETYLKKLYNAFDDINKKDILEEKETKIPDRLQSPVQDITFWHFNMWGDEQLSAFKQGNWVLALIEYEENWRTNLLRQVKPNDVIFLFKRGGAGYIGAFKALDPPSKILELGTSYNHSDYEKYDIYNSIILDNKGDSATLASNILVEPIAYNYSGVGYYSVRRRTIERMNDKEAIKFLLNRFNGKDLDKNREAGKGKLDSDTNVKLNGNYFSEIIKYYNL